MPGRAARVLISLVRASRCPWTAAWSRSSDACWTRSAAARAPNTISSSSTPRVHGVERQHALNELERPCWVVLGQQHLGHRRASHALLPLLKVGPDLMGAGQVTERRAVRAPTRREYARVEPDASPRCGVSGAGQPHAHDAPGLHEVAHRQQDSGQHHAREHGPSMKDIPLVQVAGVIMEAALVSLSTQHVHPDGVRVADGHSLARGHRLLPAHCRVQVRPLKIGGHQELGTGGMRFADGGGGARTISGHHSFLDHPACLVVPFAPATRLQRVRPGPRRTRGCRARPGTAPRCARTP